MKNLLSALILVLIIGLISVVNAQPTPYGTSITNTASVDGLNFTITSNSVATTVQTIVGAGWFGGNDDQGAIPGSWQTNLSGLTNYGNGTIHYQLTVQDYNFGGNIVADWNWEMIVAGTNYLSGSGNAGAAGGSITLAEGASASVLFRVEVNASASAATQTFRLAATSPDAYVNSTGYNGDNGTLYGGSVANGWGRRIADTAVMYAAAAGVEAVPDETLYSIVTSASPIISITKSIFSISDVTGAGAIAVPGARITYQIRVSNALGAGVATGVIVRDYVTDPNVTYDAGSQVVDGASANAWAMDEAGLPTITWSNTDASGIMNPGDVNWLRFTVTIN